MASDDKTSELTRREFNHVVGIGIPATAVASWTVAAGGPASAQSPPSDMATVNFVVNGETRTLEIDPRTTLLDALREHLGLTGTKKGCDHGQCGACTAIVDGRRMNTCLSLAVMHESSEIVTIEGLGSIEALHPMQSAFIERDGFQCGYCTPGQILSAVATLDEIAAGIPSAATANVALPSAATAEEIRERMSGNLCRCAAYPNIVAAIMDVEENSR
jgi:xanthine dehydrogenase YagT iron-sulfur-binding subunit